MKSMRFGTALSMMFIGLCTIYLPLNARAAQPTIAMPSTGVQPQKPVASIVQPQTQKGGTHTSAHLLTSIQRELHNLHYQRDILPHNFSYLRQLLRFGEQTQQTNEYAQNSFRLFSKVLKGSDYVDSYAFCDLVKDMPDLVKCYFNGYKTESASRLILSSDLDMLDRLERTVSHIVFNKFTQEFEICKKDPRGFLDDLSNRIVAAATHEVNVEQLRQMIIRFLEVGLSKLIWSPRDEEKTWECVKTISHNLAQLMEYNIIEDLDDLDELFWTLTYRYRYFLNLNGSDMSLAFYQKLKADITSKKVMLFELEAQEPILQSKASCLLSAALTQEAKLHTNNRKPRLG